MSTLLKKVVPVVCGLGKYRLLAHFQIADDTWLYKDRDNTGRLSSIEEISRVHKLPVQGVSRPLSDLGNRLELDLIPKFL